MPRQSCREDVLAAMPGTLSEIHAKCKVERSCVVRMLQRLRLAGDCHTSAWKRSERNGPIMRVYSAGPGKDAPKIKRCSNKVYNTRYKQRNPEMIALGHAAKRAKYWADKARTKPQSWLSALGAMPA